MSNNLSAITVATPEEALAALWDALYCRWEVTKIGRTHKGFYVKMESVGEIYAEGETIAAAIMNACEKVKSL